MLIATSSLSLGLVTIPEPTWRAASSAHAERMRALVAPGFVSDESRLTRDNKPSLRFQKSEDGWRALDRSHPVYNFMLEYYALKGAKSMRRLGRWSPRLEPDGVLLEGATQADLESGRLSPRGSSLTDEGISYDPKAFMRSATREQASSFLWYQHILHSTNDAPPILHCYGLHEWAMQYWPEGAPPPPSAKYQAHLPLRVSREMINAVVERRGVSCTHVDALRYFAPAAAPLNRHGATLQRSQQPELEQPACVHAAMDLLKIALKLHPWMCSDLLGDALEVAIAARTLDVAASPYDLSSYGLAPICVETEQGRLAFREAQLELMERVTPVRRRLLEAYDAFIDAGFDRITVEAALSKPNEVQFATATPGGPAWKWSKKEAAAAAQYTRGAYN